MSAAPSSSHIIQQLTFKCICLSCGFHSQLALLSTMPIANACSCIALAGSVKSVRPLSQVQDIHHPTEIYEQSMNGLCALLCRSCNSSILGTLSGSREVGYNRRKFTQPLILDLDLSRAGSDGPFELQVISYMCALAYHRGFNLKRISHLHF